MTNAVNLASAAGTGFAFRNRIINGNFAVWQRFTGSASGAGFLADRFNCYIVSGSSFLQTRYELSDANRSIIGFDTRYALQTYTDASTSIRILQPIEGVATFAGKTVTLSFWAFTETGTCSLSAMVSQSFGSGGSPSASVDTNITLSQTSVSTTPVKITATFTVPSISGKTLGTAGNDYLGVQIQKVAGHAGNLRITEIQLEEGSVATPFERRPYSLEEVFCQRFFQYMEGYWRCGNGNESEVRKEIQLLQPMRATPTVSGATYGNEQATSWSGNISGQNKHQLQAGGSGACGVRPAIFGPLSVNAEL